MEVLRPLPREERVREIFQKSGGILEGHFIAHSWKHLDRYVDKRLFYAYTQETTEICSMFAKDFKNDNIEVVIAPATGGIILSFETARLLTLMTGKKVISAFLEKRKEGGFEFHKGVAELIKDKRALDLDDVLTTGGSLKDAVDETRKAGAKVVRVGVIWNRGGVKPKDIGVEDEVGIDSLCNIRFQDWTSAECAISGPCSKGIPLTKP